MVGKNDHNDHMKQISSKEMWLYIDALIFFMLSVFSVFLSTGLKYNIEFLLFCKYNFTKFNVTCCIIIYIFSSDHLWTSDFYTQNLGSNIGVFTMLKLGKKSQKNEENSQFQWLANWLLWIKSTLWTCFQKSKIIIKLSF